jgi:hypothetical protein
MPIEAVVEYYANLENPRGSAPIVSRAGEIAKQARSKAKVAATWI